MQIGEFGNAVSELSHILSQAIVVPFRRIPARGPTRVARAEGARPGRRGLAAPARGHLLLSAGALADDLVIEVIHQVGGRKARLVVLPATAYGAEAGERYRRYFQRFGMERAETLALSTRQQAEAPAAAGSIAAADLLVIGGGHPGLLLDIVAGTAAGAAIAAAMAKGATIAAVGPAAEATGQWYLPPPESGQGGLPVALRPGLGLLPDTLVACGPQAAGRLGGLFGAALTERAQALILDDRSSLLVGPGAQAEVRAGTVLTAGAAEAAQAGSVPLGGVWTRVAPAGWRLDLAARAVLPPGASATGTGRR